MCARAPRVCVRAATHTLTLLLVFFVVVAVVCQQERVKLVATAKARLEENVENVCQGATGVEDLWRVLQTHLQQQSQPKRQRKMPHITERKNKKKSRCLY